MVFEYLLLFVLFSLAFSNGANDLSKGIATLVGSGAASYRRALAIGIVTTAAGSIAAIMLGRLLLKVFSTGLLNHAVDPSHSALAVSSGASLWVLLASRLSMPVSTTHAIVGAIIGSGVASSGIHGIDWYGVQTKTLLPLLVSPIVSFGIAFSLFPIIRKHLGPARGACVCIDQGRVVPVASAFSFSLPVFEVKTGNAKSCAPVGTHHLRLNIVDSLHLVSSGLTSFARGLNDTPKMAALLVGTQALGGEANLFSFLIVAVGMMAGGMIAGRRVTDTLSQRITTLDPIEGFSSNAVTSTLVVGGTIAGLPLSTTHVSTSSIVGIGMSSGQGVQWRVVRDIVFSWVVTLPSAGVVAFVVQKLL